MLEVESDLYRVRPVSSDERCALEVSTGDFNIVSVCEEVVGNVVDGNPIDSDECISVKGPSEVKNILDCEWL